MGAGRPKKDPFRRGTSQEKSVVMTLKDMVKTDSKVYYLLFKYAPEMIPKNTKDHPIKTWEDLKASYKCFENYESEKACPNYFYEENFQRALKWLVGRKNVMELIDVYEKLLEQAKEGNVAAFKAVVDFSKEFFKDQKQSDLMKVLAGVNLDEDEEENRKAEEEYNNLGSDDDFSVGL